MDVVADSVGDYTVYYCSLDCKNEQKFFAKNKQGKHHNCSICRKFEHQALLSECETSKHG